MGEPVVRVQRLRGFWGRLRGLLGRPPPAPGCAVWLSPCRQVHTFGMAYPIDVVHLDAGGLVVAVRTLPPWRVGPFVLASHAVLELRAGEAARLGVVAGAKPSLIDTSSGATKIEPASVS